MSAQSLRIDPVETKRDFNAFIKHPWRIYAGDPNWVPPLIMDMKTILSPGKNPFFDHSDARLFLARKNGEVLGRVAAIVNHNHNRFHNEKTGFFGFFESVHDPEVSTALLDAGKDWLSGQGMDTMRGPMNPSTNDTCGLLIDGFDSPPVLLMTYNPPYYEKLIEDYGMNKAKDLYAYYMTAEQTMPERFLRFADRIIKKEGLSFRNVSMKRFWDEVEQIKGIYNSAWSRNWGFVPMTDEEFVHLAKELKQIVDPDLVFIAEVDGIPAGFSLSVPDFHQALIHTNGRLLPFGLPKILWHSRNIKLLRVITLGVIKEYQKRGIDSVLYVKTYQEGMKKGYTAGEFSWILEDNEAMRNPIEKMGAKIYKTYRIYDYPVAG